MSDVLTTISRSLGRTVPPTRIPAPPMIDESVARLVGPTDDLRARFVQSAQAAKLVVIPTSPERLVDTVVERLRERQASRVVLTPSGIVQRMQLVDALGARGIDARWQSDTDRARLYEVDAGITDVYAAVAETGSLMLRASAGHMRSASLVPPVHIAIVEASQIVPDLIDAMHLLRREGTSSGVVLITGPSKTADIEMNLVTGVHGPGEVDVLLV